MCHNRFLLNNVNFLFFEGQSNFLYDKLLGVVIAAYIFDRSEIVLTEDKNANYVNTQL